MNPNVRTWLIFFVMTVFGIAAFVAALVINRGATV